MNVNRIHLNEVTSTNDWLKEMLRIGVELPDFTLVDTDFQTAGRGQRTHRWESQRGVNIIMSLLVHPLTIDAKDQFILSQCMSLAIQQTLATYIDDVRVKRPNDIYWRDRKISGTLIECNLEGNCIKDCIIGTGINVNQTVFESDAPNPVSLQTITGFSFDRETLMMSVVETFARLYQMVLDGNSQKIVQEYESKIYDPTTYKN